MKRINIITGHYGSGKTEIAVNMALKLKEKHDKVVICDMDIVNPYFRTNDAREFLSSKGIRVISPDYASTNIDIPVLPGDILSVFSDKSVHAVLDLGGDDDGALALGQFHRYLSEEDYEMFFVLNTLRPDTKDFEDIKTLVQNIELTSRAKLTAVINNTNLSYLTEPRHLTDSLEFVEETAKKLNLEVRYITGTSEIINHIPKTYKSKAMEIELFMKLPFDALV